MLKMTVKSGSTGDYTPGWKTVTVKSATYGDHEGNRFLDMWFEEYGDNFNGRIWEKKDKEGNEFAIANLFRFANAGIETVEANSDASTKIVQIDDKAVNLHGKRINIYLYKNTEGYARVLQRIAPTQFTNQLDTMDETSVEYWKGKAEVYFKDWVEPNIATSDTPSSSFVNSDAAYQTTTETSVPTTTTEETGTEDVFAGLPE